MDPRRFDSLARSLAAPTSRRGILGGFAALAAGLLGASAADAQDTQAQCGNKTCVRNPGICNDGCVCCLFPNGNSRCRPPGTCSPGTTICPPGQVIGPSGVCAVTTTTTTTTTPPPCVSAEQCPAGQACFNGGCFQTCPIGDECPSCQGCACYYRNEDELSSVCIDIDTFVGTCETDSQCPPGTLCSGFTGAGAHLCTQPCCAAT